MSNSYRFLQISSFTKATRPAISAWPQGLPILVTDKGTGHGTYEIHDGISWSDIELNPYQMIQMTAAKRDAIGAANWPVGVPILVTDVGSAPGTIYFSSGSSFVKQNSNSTAPISALSSTTVLGDSIMAYGFGNATFAGSFSNSHVAWCNSQLNSIGQGFDVVALRSLGGTTLEDMINTYIPLALTDNTDCVWMHCAVNNFNSAITNDPVSTIISNMKSIIATLAAAKKIVIIDTVNPVLQSGATTSKTRAAEFNILNNALPHICSQYPNVILVDTYSAMIDTSSLILNPLSNMVRTDDGIHFVSGGARAAGYKAAQVIGPRINLTPYKTAGSNLLPAFSGTGGTTTAGSGSISGTPPVNWNAQVASGSAAVTISSFAPNHIRLAITNSGGTASTVYLQATNNAAITAALANGYTVQGGFGFQATSNTLLNRVGMVLRLNNSAIWNCMTQDSSNEPTITYPQINDSGVRNCPPYVITATPTNFEFILQVNVGASTGASTVDFFAPNLSVLT